VNHGYTKYIINRKYSIRPEGVKFEGKGKNHRRTELRFLNTDVTINNERNQSLSG